MRTVGDCIWNSSALMCVADDKQVILQRLVDLHKELKNVRVRAATSSEDLPMELPNAFHHDASNGSSEQLPLLSATMSSPSAGISAQNSARKLIVCSLRRPVKLERNAAEHSGWTFTRSTGGFQAGMDFIARHATVHWVSWPGCVVDPTEQEAVREKLEVRRPAHAAYQLNDLVCMYLLSQHFHQTSPVYMDTELVDRYFYFYCGRILWPAMHNSLSDTCDVLEQSSQGWDAYQTANRLFLDALATVYNPGDVILVHDFQLMLLPSMIRQRWRDAPVCFFLQCPFPSEEVRASQISRLILESKCIEITDAVAMLSTCGRFSAVCRPVSICCAACLEQTLSCSTISTTYGSL